jgi:hypothetical protein
MRFTSPALKQRESAKKYAQRRSTAELVRRRAAFGGKYKCEGCGWVVDVIEVAHLFGKGGRRAGVPEKWASTPELCAALCCGRSYSVTAIGCHEAIDRHLAPDLLAQLQWNAVTELGHRLRLNLAASAEGTTPLDAIRDLIRQAEAGTQP